LNRTETVLAINLEKTDLGYEYKNVINEEFSKERIKKYLYKGGPPAGVDFTPTSIVTKKVESTFKSRIIKWFKNHKDLEFLDKIADELKEKETKIISDLKEKYGNISKKEYNVLITLSIQEESEHKYVGDYQTFREILQKEAIERFYHLKTIGKSKGNGKCYLCDGDKEVYGFVPNAFGFSFSNADKRGNVPNLIQTDQWKQVPICQDCGIYLEAGKKFVQQYLSFNNYGIRYFVIPQFLFKGELKEFNEFYERITDSNLKGKKYEDGIIIEEDSDEDSLYNVIKDMGDVLAFKFLFYEFKSGGKYIDILNYVESVLPTWVKKLHEAQERVKKDILFQEYNLKPNFGNIAGNFVNLRSTQSKFGIKNHNWYAAFLRNFFPKTDNKYYLDIIGFIWRKMSVNNGFIISSFMNKIRKQHRQDPENDYFVKIFTIEALMFYMFLNELNLLKGAKKMNIGSINEEYNEKNFFDLYGGFIDSPDKKASFLMGILTKKLTAVQYKVLGATPFMTKLWGLSLDQKKIQKLYPMLINKLREYKIAYRDLEGLTSLNLLESSENWNLSRDETSFYFTLGMTLGRVLKSNKKEDGGNNEQV